MRNTIQPFRIDYATEEKKCKGLQSSQFEF